MLESYRLNEGVSQSVLKSLEGHPRYLTLPKKDSKAFDIGSIVDTMLTDNDNFYKIYAVFDGDIPTEKMKLLADEFVVISLHHLNMGNHPDFLDTLMQARAKVEYDSRLKPTTVVDKFNNEALAYTDFCIDNKDKTVISSEDFLNCKYLANSCIEAFPEWFNPTDYVEIKFQTELYFNYIINVNGEEVTIPCKALPDIIKIDHIEKTIELADIKTYEDDFAINYWKYKYYYQAEWYLHAVIVHNNETNIPRDYTVKPYFDFLAIDKSRFKGNLKYRHFANAAIWAGGLLNNNGRTILVKGFKNLLKEYHYYESNANWNYPYEFLTKGYITL